MASKVEDCSNIEVNCLPSGSVSFGRFESESLTWERRSSFSHNRYLEEVEKYSTPGSVIKKKAYFEAHFKKTALRNLDLFVRQSETDGQAENEMDDQANCAKEFTDHGNGELRFEDFEDHANFGIQFSWYDETPDASDEEKHEIMDADKRKESSPPELPVEAADSNVGTNEPVTKANSQLAQHGETVKTSPGCDVTEQVNDVGDVIVGEKSENIIESVDAQTMDTSAHSSMVKKVHVSSLKKASKALNMAKSTIEQKTRKVKSGTGAHPTQIKRKVSTENIRVPPGTSPAKGADKTEKVIPVRLRQSSSKVSPSTCSGPQHTKSEASDKMRVKVRSESRSSFNSDKGEKTKAVLVPRSTSHQQGQVGGRKSMNRDKKVTNTMKLGTRMTGALLSFKSDERAEKRKEFYTMLEEKQHHKEAEMNEFQARKQAVGGPAKSPKLQNKSTSTPGSRGIARANSPSLSKSSNPRGPSTSGEHLSSTQQDCLAKVDHNNSRAKSEAAAGLKQTCETDRTSEAANKDDRSKANSQQQKTVNKAKKRDGVSNVRRSIMGKVIKGMGAGSVAVRVAS